MFEFEGTPLKIGAYGEKCRERILANLKVLVHRQGYSPLPRHKASFQDWVRRQKKLLEQPDYWRRWPGWQKDVAAHTTIF